MIRIKYGAKTVNVNLGMARNWGRAFADVRVPEGWTTSLEVEGHYVRFSFAKVRGARTVPDGEYIIAAVHGTRETIGSAHVRYSILRVMDALRPEGPGRSGLQYIDAASLASFSDAEAAEWRRAGKMATV